jgi:hypothetical protein
MRTSTRANSLGTAQPAIAERVERSSAVQVRRAHLAILGTAWHNTDGTIAAALDCRMRTRWLCVACLGLHAACGSDGETTASPSSEWNNLESFEDKFPAACEALTAAIESVQAQKSCTTNADCVVVEPGCFSARENCSGAVYVNTTATVSTIEDLFDGATTCENDAPCCTAWPALPACISGWCTWEQSATDVAACLSKAGGSSACELCLCTASYGSTRDCLTDPACAPIFACARDAGCYGTLDCDLASPNFPCVAEVNAAGGPTSATALAYRLSNAHTPITGCHVACAGP